MAKSGTKGEGTRQPKFPRNGKKVDTLIEHIKDGINFKAACALAGLSYDSFRYVFRNDQKFKEKIENAQSLYELTLNATKKKLLSEKTKDEVRAKIYIYERNRIERSQADSKQQYINAIQKAQQMAISKGEYEEAKKLAQVIEQELSND